MTERLMVVVVVVHTCTEAEEEQHGVGSGGSLTAVITISGFTGLTTDH